MKKLNVKTQNRNVQFEQKLFQLLLNLLVLPVVNVIRAFSIYSVFPIRLKGINQIMPSVITLAVLGISLIMLVYMTDTFKTALNSTNSLVVAVFDKLFGFYDLVASFLSPIGVIIILTVILGLVIGLLAYFRGVSGTA